MIDNYKLKMFEFLSDSTHNITCVRCKQIVVHKYTTRILVVNFAIYISVRQIELIYVKSLV